MMTPPRPTRAPLALLVSSLLLLTACDRAAVQPDLTTGLNPAGPQVRTVGGFFLSQSKLQAVYDRLTRDLALSLQDAGVRSAVYAGLHASPYPEHKVHFRTFLRGDGRALLEGAARVRHVVPEVVFATLDSLVDFEFYMPVKDHWAQWTGDGNLLVVNDLSDDDGVLPALFDPAGNPVAGVSEDVPPVTPTLSLVPAETDFSKPPAAPMGAARAVQDAGPGLYMVSSYIQDLHEPWPSGPPEIEIHAFVRNGAGNYVDLQCGGQDQAAPFRFDQDDHTYSGPEVEVIPEDGIGTNPLEVSIWENDYSACDPTYGRPPVVSGGNFDQFTAWGARPTVTVSLVNSIKVVSSTTLGIPLVADTAFRFDYDDEIGETRVPSCWPSTSGTYFALYMSDPGHPWNGNAKLDYRFGQRDPICPPPSFSVSVSGPGSDTAYATVTVTATPANYVSPVHYAWTINDVVACADETTCTGNLGAPLTYTTFAVTATDGAGSMATSSLSVLAEDPGCPGCGRSSGASISPASALRRGPISTRRRAQAPEVSVR